MKKTKKDLASLVIAGMILSMVPYNVFAASSVPTRIAGITAEQTAIAIANQTGYTGTAILASSASYGMVDALTAGPLAYSLKAPILLTGAGSTLDEATKAELTKLTVNTIYVTSGTAVIKQGVLDQLTGMGITVIPLGGFDRSETSVNIAKKMTGVTKVAVANSLPDALSMAAVAAAANQPILLTNKDALPSSVASYVTSVGITKTDVIGGTGVISDAVNAALPGATRHAGITAYDTNNQVIQDFADALKFENIYVANGVTGIDALAGAPLAAQTQSAIVLTDGKTVPAAAAFTYSKSSASTVVTALGGEAVVPEKIRLGVAAAQVPTAPGNVELSIVSVSALDDTNKHLEIVFSKPVTGLQTSDFTIKNANTMARYGIEEVKMHNNDLTATVELYAQDGAMQVLAYRQDYIVAVNVKGTTLTKTFNRPYSFEVRVQDINVGDKKIVAYIDNGANASGKVTLEVPDTLKFDYAGALGELIQVWFDGDNKLVNYKILSSEAKVDSIEVTDIDEIKLLGADETFDISTAEYGTTTKHKFAFYVDGVKKDIKDFVDQKFNFAKVGFDLSGDIEFVSAYALRDIVLVDSVDDNEVIGIDGSGGFDAEDTTIIKNGKIIALADLEKGDLLFYSEDADNEDGYAEVLNNKVATGEIEEVYNDSIKVDGETYDYLYQSDIFEYNRGKSIYINEDGEAEDVDSDVAEELQAAGDVALYTDYAGNLIYISGDTASVEGNAKVAVLTEDIVGYRSSKDKVEIDVLTQDEEELSIEIALEDLDTVTVGGVDYDIDNDSTTSDWSIALDGTTGIDLNENAGTGHVDIDINDEANAGSLVKLKLDDDGSLDEIEFFDDTDLNTISLEAGDKYLEGFKMKSNTLLFDATDGGINADAEDIVVRNFGDYKGAEITSGNYILNDDGDEVLAVWYNTTDSSDSTYDEAVVTKVLRNTDAEVVSITVYAGGEEKTYDVDEVDDHGDLKKGSVVILEFDEDNDTLVTGLATDAHDITFNSHAQYDERVLSKLTVGDDDVSVADKTVITNNGTFKLADNGLVLDATDPSDISVESLSDLRGETNVTVVKDSINTTYAKFFIIGGSDSGTVDKDTVTDATVQ